MKDLRIFADRDLKDVVIVDNSVYSFAFQIDNGIPIIPFYNDKQDEEMLHLVYYLNCLAKADDVREQNRQAFELFKLSNGESLQDSTMATEAVPGQYYDDNQEEQEGYFASNEVVDLTGGQQYTDLQDPSQPHGLPQNHDIGAKQSYQIDDVIHEDCREDFNSYNESGPNSRKTDESTNQLRASGAERYRHHMAYNMSNGHHNLDENDYKSIEDVDAVGEYPDGQNTEEATSPMMYNQVAGGHMLAYDQHP